MAKDCTPSAHRGVFTAEVLANEWICSEHYRLILKLQAFPPTQPGQFVQLLCRPPGEPARPRLLQWRDGQSPELSQAELLGRQPMLRRPFSIAGRRDGAGGVVELEIIYRTVGVGTRWLAGAPAGAALSILGPLGNAFDIHPDKPVAALVGGGVGIPPMLYMAEALAAAGKRTVAFSGAQTAGLLPLGLLPAARVSPEGSPSECIVEFAAFGAEAAVATDDGTLGAAGLVSDVLERWLDGGQVRAEDLAVYACGPEPMMRAVGEMCIARGTACQLSLERVMACGMGTCQSCVCKLRADSAVGWEYKLCCADGPVFDAGEIVWD